MEEEYTYEEFEDTYEAEPPKKQRKLWLWILVAVLAVAVLAVGAILILPKLGGSSAGDEWTLRNAYIASDKSAAYIILPDGESVKVKKDGIVSARITEDLKHIAVLLDDGTLYVTDKDLKAKQTIAENATSFSLSNNALIYHDKDGRYHRTSLDGKDVLDLPKDIGDTYISAGKDKLSMAFEKNENLYVLPNGADEWTKLGGDLYSIRSLTNDGKLVLWTARKDGKYVQYLTENDERVSLGEYNSSLYSYAMYSKDQKLMIGYAWRGDEIRIWIKQRGKDVQTVKFTGDLYDLISDAGRIPKVNASQIKYIYAVIRSDGKSNLYQISLSGEKEKVLSKTETVRFMSGNVAYLDDDGDLYVAKMGKKELGEATKLAGDAKWPGLYGDGKYLYYMRDDVLYGYQFGAKEPVKIASDVEDFQVSENGRYVVVMKDGNDTTGYALSMWKFGGKSPTKIASDGTVIRVEDSGKVYYRHIDGRSYDLMYYNGKESKKIGTDLPLN